MNAGLRVLIVGGYGTFGGRLVHLLRDEPRLVLLVAGRSFARAAAFCASIGSEERIVPVCFDREGDLDAQLTALRPSLLVDASGPFQVYGARPYRLAQACIQHGIDYLDLADGAQFVCGIQELDYAAKSRGVFVLAGASTCPVLTTAVVGRLSSGLAQIRTIRAGIAPSAYAGVGVNVVRAIAGYAGESIRLWRDARAASGYGFLEQQRFTIAPPGRIPLRSRPFSLIDVPDLELLPRLWPTARTVWMGAGPVPVTLHRLLILLAWLRRMRLIPSVAKLAPLLHWTVQRIRWGEHRGGMFVAIEGTDHDGKEVSRSWHMLAEGDDGPFIPSMAAESLIRKLIAGHRPAAGARSAAGELALADYEQRFASRAIFTGVRAAPSPAAPLYERTLGSVWLDLPPQLRELHDLGRPRAARGLAEVRRGSGLLARCVAAMVGFPRAGDCIAVTVTLEAINDVERGGVERWTRNFAGRSFVSEQSAGRGRDEGLVCERFGPFSVSLALVWDAGRLSMIVRGARFLGLPLPRWLVPTALTHECVESDRFHFDVAISHPLTGLLVHYRGWLTPVPDSGLDAARAGGAGVEPANPDGESQHCEAPLASTPPRS